MPQRQAITILIIYRSKPQQNDAVTRYRLSEVSMSLWIRLCNHTSTYIHTHTPTPLAHRSHTCMRALALGHDIYITTTIPPRISRLIPSRPQVEATDGSPRYASRGARRGRLERRVFCHSQAADAAVKVKILIKVFRENLNRPQLWACGEGWCSRDGQSGPETNT